MIADAAAALRREARRVDERRLLVVAGAHDAALGAADRALDGAGVDRSRVTLVGEDDPLGVERLRPEHAGDLLGATRAAVVLDCHAGLRPNAVGRTVGAVEGGGLYVLACPPLEEWPDRRDAFDRTLAVPPFDPADVTGHFRRRFVDTLRTHSGIAVYDADARRLARDGLTHPAPRLGDGGFAIPEDPGFPRTAYRACLTEDQVEALGALEALRSGRTAVVLEADRGRGKSSVAGLAAGSLAAAGEDVLVTAPRFRAAREVLRRADALLGDLGSLAGTQGDPPRLIETAGGGCVHFVPPADAVTADSDVLVVDEAAAIGVPLLRAFLDADRVAFATTIHGYEGAGRGFSVRFRDRLGASDHDVTEASLAEPIRYAAGDPVEVWAFRALLLDASPPPGQVVADATPDSVVYRALDPVDLVADEALLREAFGLLVLAHYRTEPDDLARLLDAPNVAVRALLQGGHVAAVALLAREGGLPADTRADVYDGGRIRGNMLPDVLMSQLRDEAAGAPQGIRVMRIATHAAVRRRGLGSHLLDRIRGEFDADWFGAGFGATPDLVSFWADNGFSTVHLSTTRSERSGEHSALMLAPASPAGERLHDRHASRFAGRIGAVLSDALSDLDPDVARATLRATDATVDPDLDDDAWRLVAGMAYGPALADVDPRPFRRLALAHLIDPVDPGGLSAREERLLVLKVLQGRGWSAAADTLGYPSGGACMRALGDAYKPLVDAHGPAVAREERERHTD